MRDNSVAQFFWTEYLSARELRPESARQIEMSIRALDRWYGRPVELRDLSRELLNRFLAEHAREHAPKTVSRRRGDILALWRLAAELGLADDPPKSIRKVKQPRKIPEAWTREEIEMMIRATKREGRYYPTGVGVGVFWEMFLRVTYDTGLRWADVMRLEVRRVQEGIFEVMQEKTGTGILRRLSEATLETVGRSVPPERRLLFPWCYSREVFYTHWRKFVLIPAGLPTGRTEGPQKLRRTSASHLEAVSPGAAMSHLGHLTPGLAYRHYVDPRIARARSPLPPALPK